ncbi:uncharacterized protein [Henckelia pumila]|uniref:uncharacterized protein n=1 Tax=Henckelia pumila TaxID=405737 RepID=UPI003C6DE49B
MRQRRWLELVKYYDCDIYYYSGKANLVADALSRKSVTLNQLTTQRELIADFERLKLDVVELGEVCILSSLTVVPSLPDRIQAGQALDQELVTWNQKDEAKGGSLYTTKDGIVHHKDKIWVPTMESLRIDVMKEVHTAPYFIHPESKNIVARFYFIKIKMIKHGLEA